MEGSPAPLPQSSFGANYNDLIPADATLQSYDSKRFAIITGIVDDTDGNPLPGVEIRVLYHPEYGTAATDDNGRFSMPVDGGGTVTVVYNKTGFVSTQRQAVTPWNDIAVAETVQMIQQDAKSTTVRFDGNPATIVTHTSTPVNDDRGARSCSMVFTGDNVAHLQNDQGADVGTLKSINVRASEFTTPSAMPAALPPTSAFTYCADFSVDGAQQVRFAKPVFVYVDNFLGFSVGTVVPVGYYDWKKGVWIPEANGVVVELLDTNDDGIVDALDATGSGQPTDLNGDGSFSDEVAGLSGPSFHPGATYWRIQVTHFSIYDCNWPYGLPPDAIPPNPLGDPTADDKKANDKDCA